MVERETEKQREDLQRSRLYCSEQQKGKYRFCGVPRMGSP